MKKSNLKSLKLNKKIISNFYSVSLKGGHTSLCTIKTQCNCLPLSDRCPKPTHSNDCPPLSDATLCPPSDVG